MQAQLPKPRKVRCACGWLGLARDMRIRSIFREGVLVTTYHCWRCLRREVVWRNIDARAGGAPVHRALAQSQQ